MADGVIQVLREAGNKFVVAIKFLRRRQAILQMILEDLYKRSCGA